MTREESDTEIRHDVCMVVNPLQLDDPSPPPNWMGRTLVAGKTARMKLDVRVVTKHKHDTSEMILLYVNDAQSSMFSLGEIGYPPQC